MRKATKYEFIFEGSKTYFWQYAAEKNAPSILAIHGFRGTHHGLQRIIDALPECEFIVPDLPGFGDSQPFAKRIHDAKNYASFVAALAKEIDRPLTLLGHSFGTIVVAKMEETYPAISQKVIFAAPITRRARDEFATKFGDLYYAVGRKLPIKSGEKWLASRAITRGMGIMMMKTRDRELRRYVHDQHLTYFSRFANRQTLLEAYDSASDDELRNILPNIAKPVLIIAGTNDMISKFSQNKIVAEKLNGNSQLIAIEKTGHLLHYEKPTDVADAIREFI